MHRALRFARLLGIVCVLGPLGLAVQSARAETTEAPEAAPMQPLARGSRVAVLPSITVQTKALAGGHAQHEEAARAVSTALRKHGYEVLGTEQVRVALDGKLPDGCRDAVTCDPALALQTLRVDAVVSLALWHRAGGQDQLLVYVRRERGYGQAELPITDKGVGDTAALALDKALADTLLRHEVRVRVESRPRGASVHIDQALVGATPATLDVAPGNHLVTVEMPGYVTAANYVDVPATGKQVFVHSVELVRSPGSEAPAAPPLLAANGSDANASAPMPAGTAGGGTDWNVVLGTGLGAVAVALLVYGFVEVTADGDCGAHDAQQRCTSYVDASFSTPLVAAGLAAVGSAVFLVAQPITISSNGTTASLQLRMKY